MLQHTSVVEQCLLCPGSPEPRDRKDLRGDQGIFANVREPHSFFMRTINQIHIGSIIAEQMKRRGISYARMAQYLHLERSTIYSMLKQKSIDTERLFHISRILDCDLYAIVYQPLLDVSKQSEQTASTTRDILDAIKGNHKITITIHPHDTNPRTFPEHQQ